MYQQEKTLKNLKYNNKIQEKNRTLQIVEKANLQNDKIPSKSNYETISPKTHSQMNRNTVNK